MDLASQNIELPKCLNLETLCHLAVNFGIHRIRVIKIVMTNQKVQKQAIERRTLLMAFACIALLFQMTTIQASHLCGSQFSSGTDSANTVQSQITASNSTVCVLCLMTQPVVAIFLLIAFAPAVRRSTATQAADASPGKLFSSFQLYVRPPPIY
ncbi:MAG: hypothetical protein ABJA69_03520 [Acidobacteriaceae bacterium]